MAFNDSLKGNTIFWMQNKPHSFGTPKVMDSLVKRLFRMISIEQGSLFSDCFYPSSHNHGLP